ncbi:Retrovirus-related Pol polyprotein from transposon RE1 [Abeliophyllum distichum]|uniref:Retrovirus-related Pol polyprotein from transposon RE1 n=1 Tax=Abeliophyllum distichum TaxID=126358 RepID=A0ABD1RT52_9LAMI
MSMDHYLSTIKQLTDNQGIAGKKIDHANLVTQVLARLDEEYNPIVVQVNCRDQVSWHELSSTLMTFESRLEYLCQVKNNFGSINLTQGSSQNIHSSNPSAYIASPNSVEDQAWYADSGASHHVTTDKNNVDEAKEYADKQKMIVGNGTSLQISRVGSKVFNIEYDKSLVLKRLIHVPRIKKNHISVSKLTTDNNVCIEFFPHGCAVKDLPTRKALVQEKLEDGLYQLKTSKHKLSQ